MTKTVEVMENEAQEFVDYAAQRGFTVNQPFIDSVILELKAVGLFRENISLKTYKMGLSAAIDSGKIVAPAPKPTAVDIAAAAERLQNAFPPVMTARELAKQKRDAAANAGIAVQTGRKSHASIEDSDSMGFSTVRDKIRLTELRSEYKTLLSQAESAVGNNPKNHAETYRLRARLLSELKNNKKYDQVRD